MARRYRGPDRHLVHGVWMTEAEAAEKLGRSRWTVMQWRYRHRREDGKPMLLVEAWDHFTALDKGWIKPQYGRKEKLTLKGRPAYATKVAKKLGIPVGSLYSHMHNHKCGLDGAVRYYEAKRQKKAEQEILRIINGG